MFAADVSRWPVYGGLPSVSSRTAPAVRPPLPDDGIEDWIIPQPNKFKLGVESDSPWFIHTRQCNSDAVVTVLDNLELSRSQTTAACAMSGLWHLQADRQPDREGGLQHAKILSIEIAQPAAPRHATIPG